MATIGGGLVLAAYSSQTPPSPGALAADASIACSVAAWWPQLLRPYEMVWSEKSMALSLMAVPLALAAVALELVGL